MQYRQVSIFSAKFILFLWAVHIVPPMTFTFVSGKKAAARNWVNSFGNELGRRAIAFSV